MVIVVGETASGKSTQLPQVSCFAILIPRHYYHLPFVFSTFWNPVGARMELLE